MTILTPEQVIVRLHCTKRQASTSDRWDELVLELGQKAMALRAEVDLRLGYERNSALFGSYVYFAHGGSSIKIGMSTSVPLRISQLQIHCPHRLTVLGVVPGARDLERAIHARFRGHRLTGEWFKDCADIRDLILMYCEERHLDRAGVPYALRGAA